jgi:ubiquinone/menaquinone biosynthesis C-methylase UbiE
MTSLDNHNPENYNTNASFVYSDKFTSPVLALLNAQPGEVIVDLGCGTGELTARLCSAVGSTGRVVGIDSSQKMVSSRNQSTVRSLAEHYSSMAQPLDYLA